MTAFEFFTVLLSFVVSLGVAMLLGAIARLIQESRRVRFSLSYALWAAVIFNLQVTYWLKAWTYHDSYELHMSTSMPPLILAIIAFLACGLATPHLRDEGPIDLVEFHVQQVRKYACAMAAFMLAAILQAALMDPVVDVGIRVLDTVSQLGFAGMFILAGIFRRVRWLQIVVPAVYLASSTFYYYRLIG